MFREVIKLTQGAQHHHVAPPVSSLEASPWEYEDPGDVVEGEEQGVASGGGCDGGGDGEGAVAVRAEGALQKFGERAEGAPIEKAGEDVQERNK